jgi:2'-5' RNA ligase
VNSNGFLRVNTAFKPPEEVVKRAISLSRKIEKNNKAVFVLDGLQYHPHITIYSPEYPAANLNEILKVVQNVAGSTAKILFVFKEIKSVQGFIVVYFELNPEIKRLHEGVVTELNPLREGHLMKKYQPGADYQLKFSSKQQESIEKYGYHRAMSLYHPHLTIIRLEDESSAKMVARHLTWAAPQFTVEKLAVYAMGEHGTCRELIQEFPLKD